MEVNSLTNQGIRNTSYLFLLASWFGGNWCVKTNDDASPRVNS
jgi:hypothetical protein